MHKKALYFIAILPPAAIREQVTNIKLDFASTYHSSHALKSPPHVTLIPPFMATSEIEKKVIHLLCEAARDMRSFNMVLNGFGAFKPRVIYINIAENHTLQRLAKELANQFKHIPGLDRRKLKYFHPHMSVAFRDLDPQMFHSAWEKYCAANFEASFEVKSLFLLKHNGKYWDIYHEISFAASKSPS